MTVHHIDPSGARRLLGEGAALIDVREADERAREWIPESRPWPLSAAAGADLALAEAQAVVFLCKSGLRTGANAELLAGKAGEGHEVYILDGGLDAWRKAGLPVATNAQAPIEIQRQVQIAAGSLVFLGTLLGLVASPWFFVVPLFVGAGLTFAGVSGYCGMAFLLARAPWNKVSTPPAAA